MRGFGFTGVAAGVGAGVVFEVVGATFAGLVTTGTTAERGFPDVGVVAAGVAAGNIVIVVGNGGNGLDSTLAIISFKPASD